MFIMRPQSTVIIHGLLQLGATLDDRGAALSASSIPCRRMTAPPGWISRFRGPSAISSRSEPIVLIDFRLLWSWVQG